MRALNSLSKYTIESLSTTKVYTSMLRDKNERIHDADVDTISQIQREEDKLKDHLS